MSFFFGNLTNSFVNFGKAVVAANGDLSDPNLKAAEDDFRTIAAQDASYLAYIGVGTFFLTYLYMGIWVYTGEWRREFFLPFVVRAADMVFS